MPDWKQYAGQNSDRVYYEDPTGFLVIVPKDSLESSKIPISCPLCGCLFRSRRDEEAYAVFKSCDWCALEGIKTSDEAMRKLASRIRPTIIVDV